MRRTAEKMTAFQGLDLSAAKIHLAGGGMQICENFSLERGPGTRIRPGFARLLDNLSRIFSYDRDDNTPFLVMGVSTVVAVVQTGDPEWT